MQAHHLNGTVHIVLVGDETLTEVIGLTCLLQDFRLKEGKGRVVPARTTAVLVLDRGDRVLLDHREYGFVLVGGFFLLFRLCTDSYHCHQCEG